MKTNITENMDHFSDLQSWELEDKLLQIHSHRENEQERKDQEQYQETVKKNAQAWKKRKTMAKVMRVTGYILLAIVMVYIAAAAYESNLPLAPAVRIVGTSTGVRV